MSYNIDQWKTKRLENLEIPLSAFYLHPREDWHPNVTQTDDAGTVLIEGGCEQEIHGKIHGPTDAQIITVTGFNMSGEGSGTFWGWILKPALQKSTGILEAVTIWEGGDSICRITVKDGEVTEQKVEL